MTPEKAGLGEQALNKITEMALASLLEGAKQLKVQIKTDLSKLAHGEVDSILININGLVMQQDLVLEELDLQINRVTVKPLSALMGKIKLLHPSEGTLRIVLNEDNLTRALNSESFQKNRCVLQSFSGDKRVSIHVQRVKCCLVADGNIAFNSELMLDKTGEAHPITFTAKPRIGTDRQGIALQDVHYVKGKELAPELTAVLVAQTNEVLSLRNFEQKGMSLRIQQLEVTIGKLTWQAAVYIEQFPSS